MKGRIARLDSNADERLKVPHVGWNALDFTRGARLLRGLDSGAQVYFTHSYAAPVTPDCVAATTHANRFASAVERDNIWGVQFHPEKSGDAGLQILRNFLEMAGSPRR
jgi:glutamine amidotransferase